MKRLLLIGILTSFSFFNAFGQTTATDFTVNDCSGNAYDLFAKLDQGKIVVLAWVMPCSTCIVDPIAAYAITESYAASHPNKIDFIIVDDYANTQCGSLVSWVSQYQMTNANVIVNGAVSMSDYGVDGMPKIVLLSGDNHQIYFNENSSSAGFQEALDLALSENDAVVGIEELESGSDVQLSLYPNPATNSIQVTYELGQAAEVKLEIVNALGAQVMTDQFEGKREKGLNSTEIDLSSLTNGVYFLRMSSESKSEIIRFIVSH